jgi:ferritin
LVIDVSFPSRQNSKGDKMENDFIAMIEESINLELNVSDLYLIFYELFPDDAAFWWKLVLEEKNHAAIFRSGKDVMAGLEMFPQNLLHNNLQEIKNTNNTLLSIIKNFKNISPSREEAFNTALEIESSAAELHFQDFMNDESNLEIVNIFKQLNKDDKNHAMRIRSYMIDHGIAVKSKQA